MKLTSPRNWLNKEEQESPSVIGEKAVSNGEIKPEALDWDFINIKLRTGEEIFTRAAQTGSQVLMERPIRFYASQDPAGRLRVQVANFNPFTDDTYTIIDKNLVMTANVLSTKYRLVYKRAMLEYYGIDDQELIDSDYALDVRNLEAREQNVMPVAEEQEYDELDGNPNLYSKLDPKKTLLH